MPGLLVFADATKAFDRVQHPYLIRTMQAMRIPQPWIDLFCMLLRGATTRVKINGYLGCPIHLRNGVRQGDPCAALAYLISIQPYLSLLSSCSRVHRSIPCPDGSFRLVKLLGIPIPSLDGSSYVTRIAVAMADDVAAALRDTSQLPGFKLLLAVHERASGGLNNWLKTFCLRVGLLRGSTALPPDWDPTHGVFTADVIRYLGIFTGLPASVLAQWLPPPGTHNSNDLTSRMERRLALWISLGVSPTYAGRNLTLKNSVLAMAWYLAENQTLPEIDAILTRWQRLSWSYIESSATSLRSLPLDSPPPSAHHVSRNVLVQDYAEGGRRCISVELFVRALRARVVRGLIEPCDHPYVNLAFYWIRLSYPSLPLHPRQLLLSNCDFGNLHPDIPPFWREVLHAWGTQGDGLRPPPPPDAPPPYPQPTYQLTCPRMPIDDHVWRRSPTRRAGYAMPLHPAVVLSQPIAFNPLLAGCFGAPVRDAPSPSPPPSNLSTVVSLIRPRSANARAASTEQLTRLSRLADRGITHVVDLVSLPSRRSPLRLLTPHELSCTSAHGRCNRIPAAICHELLASLPAPMSAAISQLASLSSLSPDLSLHDLCLLVPYPPRTWVYHIDTGYIYSVVSSTTHQHPLPPTYFLAGPYTPRPDLRLVLLPDVPAPAAAVPASSLRPLQVWTASRLTHCQDERDHDADGPDAPNAPPTAILLGGSAVDFPRLFGIRSPFPICPDPTTLVLTPRRTDRAPVPIPASQVDVYSLYHLFLKYAWCIPRTLDPSLPPRPDHLTTSTTLVHLLEHAQRTRASRQNLTGNSSQTDEEDEAG